MNLVYCISSLYNPGGMERVLTRKVNYLVTTGQYDITIITVEQAGKPVYFPLHESVRLVDLDVDFKVHFNWNLLTKTWLYICKLRLYKQRLTAYLRLHPADLCISLCGTEIEFFGSLDVPGIKMAEIHFAREFRKQFLTVRHSSKAYEWIGMFRTWRLERCVRKLAHLVVLTKADAITWRNMRGKITQIYNLIEAVGESNNIGYEKTIIAVGRLEPEKGFDYLIEAWNLVAVRHPDWTLHIWGQGSCRKLLEDLIIERKLENQVFLKGTTRNVIEEYQRSYAYVLSSFYEGLPMVLLEAMSCRLPLVAFDCPCGPAETIQEGKNGFLVPVGDCQALAERICRLIEDPELRERMAAESLVLSEAYHLEKIMKQWMALFDSLVKKQDECCA